VKALDWAVRLNGNERIMAISSFAGAWAQIEPAEASDFVAQLPAGELQSKTAMAVIASWANQDPRGASTWAIQLPEGSLREQGVREAINAWATQDPEGVKSWAMNLNASATKDIALNSYAESVAYWAPKNAAAVIDAIADEQKKQESIEVTMRAWLSIDPEAARVWLAHLNVSNDIKQRMQAL